MLCRLRFAFGAGEKLENLVRMKEQCIRQAQIEEKAYERSVSQLKRQKRLMYMEMEQECRLQQQLSFQKQKVAAGV